MSVRRIVVNAFCKCALIGWPVCLVTITIPAVAAEPVAVTVGPKAPELEQYAGRELCGYLQKLYGIHTAPVEKAAADADVAILVGSPKSNPNVAEALGPADWPEVTDQGVVLKLAKLDGKPALVIGGGSPKATMWAVYELVERWGVHYLMDRDVFPAKGPWPGLPELDVVMEPNMRIRCWRMINEHAHGPISWSLEETQRFLHQMAKMKYNRIHLQLWAEQPFVHYTFRGVAKPPGVFFFGRTFPLDDDTIGREKLPGTKFYTLPDLVEAKTPEAVHRGSVALARGILGTARRLGMETGLSFQPLQWPKVFEKVIPGCETQPGRLLCTGPGKGHSTKDPVLLEMAATVVRAYLETYPNVDYIHVGMPEFRTWVDHSEESHKELVARYPQANLPSYKDLCAKALARTSFAGGGKRVEDMVKGDLAAIRFFDSLFRNKSVLKRPGGGPDIKLVYSEVATELFPLLVQAIPPGGEVLSVVGYTASRQLRQIDVLRQVPPKHVPANLIITLDDDNVGVMPQLATGSIHTLLGELRNNGWAGFYTRYWNAGGMDPTICYLARASWDASATPEQVYTDQVRGVCGADAVEPTLTAFAVLEEITKGLDQHGLGFGFPVPELMTKHYRPSRLPKAIQGDHELYRQGLALMEEAHRRSRPEGRAYTGYFVARFRFAVQYLDAIAAYRATAIAEENKNLPEAIKHAEEAVQAIRDALNAQLEIARDGGDLGGVAVMNHYCYRPLRDKLKELQAASEN